MNAKIFFNKPFSIERGTKLRLTNVKTGENCICYFTGYKTLGQTYITDNFDLYPLFKQQTKDGKISTRDVELVSGGVIGFSEAHNYDVEFLTDKGNDVVDKMKDYVRKNLGDRYGEMRQDLLLNAELSACELAEALGLNEGLDEDEFWYDRYRDEILDFIDQETSEHLKSIQ